MIYFIRQTDYIKIGFTENINNRLSDIQVGTPYEVTVALLIPGTMEEEQELHKRFSHLNIRGEWFLWQQELREYMEQQRSLDMRYDYGLIDEAGLDPAVQTTMIRNMENMTLREVGEKLGITPQSVKETESRELNGTISLNVMRKYGKALGYDFIYRFTKKNDSE